ncbi:hypothetical protein J9253_09965 [Thiothrix litoralis]|uniref:DUF2559 domain-containing protein n=1 Tax=Thiothrix litoralis TaxID=2891210 RepID=A0ABX7X0B9_9GAMM|nr:YhfG family protein [Thiothrix litoralis]QTR48208.1 hypothetical protein J9253_09965 [Thiothrix litoralis]
MLIQARNLARFRQIRRRNYRASLRLEGFAPSSRTHLDEQAPLLSPQDLESRIAQIKARYVG